ncbi:hypothetical protein PLUTE_b6009 [Pseudoalteromonas luteoviolacea DSM 6061]|nr:hypothetical protein [Pseudoalteromonas luteoviolacea DSM 6061]
MIFIFKVDFKFVAKFKVVMVFFLLSSAKFKG